jgi:hypothetical protein
LVNLEEMEKLLKRAGGVAECVDSRQSSSDVTIRPLK